MSSFLHLFYSKSCYPREQGFKLEAEKWWVIKRMSFILLKGEAFIKNCIAFPLSQKEHFHFAFFFPL